MLLAVTLNALGQLEALLDRPEEARRHYRRALTFLPSFIEASLNLGSCTSIRNSIRIWATRAERLFLEDVEAIATSNKRSMILLGQLYAIPFSVAGTTYRPSSRKRCQTQAPGGSWAPYIWSWATGRCSGASALGHRTGHQFKSQSRAITSRAALDPKDVRKHKLLKRAAAWMWAMSRGKNGPQPQESGDVAAASGEAALKSAKPTEYSSASETGGSLVVPGEPSTPPASPAEPVEQANIGPQAKPLDQHQ